MKETFTVDQLTNGGFTLNVIGRDYRFSELRMKDYGRLQNHLKRIQPKAVDVLTSAVGKLNMAPADLTEAILTANERDLYWPVSVDSPPGLSMIQNDDEARTDFVKFVLEKHQPSISTGEAREVVESLSLREFSQVAVFAVTGKMPEEIVREQQTQGESTRASTGTSG
jgi:hypothetical protein